MNSRFKRFTIGTSLLVTFSLAQVYIGASFAGSDPPAGRPRVVGRNAAAGILITSGKQAILVNGISAVTDATIMSGASIESPEGVSATINLRGLGRVDIAPATSLKLDFSDLRIRVSLIRGCVILLTKGITIGTVETPYGVAGGTRDTSKGNGLDVCQSDGATALVNQGAAANAGAGASATTAGGGGGGGGGASSAATAAGAASGGLNPALGVFIAASLIIPMVVAAVVLNNCDRGTNPSPELNTQCT